MAVPATRSLAFSALLLLTAPVGAAERSAPRPAATPPATPELAARRVETFAPTPRLAPREIRLANGISFDTRAGEPALPERLRASAPASADERIGLLVQVEAPARSDWARELEAAGASIETSLPAYAYLVRIAAADRDRIERLPFVVWTGEWHPAYRIADRVAAQPRGVRSEYSVLLFDDGSPGAVGTRVGALGGAVREVSDNGINRILQVELDRDGVEALAAHPDVQWVEPREVFVVHNDQVQWVDMTNVVGDREIWDEGIDGTGQVVHVGDSGVRTSHDMFRDNAVPITSFGDYPTHRKIIAYLRGSESLDIAFGDASGASYHGTHTSGTFAGNDAGFGSSLYDGVAKGAKIYFTDIGGSSTSLYAPGDLNDYFGPPYVGNAGGAARVSSNSWGSATQGNYTISCMTTDQFAASHEDFLICFSNGNSGGANTVGSPASAKNLLSVGGTRNGTSANLIYSSTSRGPTDDGRFKPTICSPGQAVISAGGNADASYTTKSGTSMASPNTAGSAALARQYFTDGWYPTGAPVGGNAFTPSAALLRAMLVASGQDDFASYTPPDQNIGWGRILLDRVLYFPGETRRLAVLDEADGVVTGEAREWEIWVADGSEDLKIALVWTDPASTPAAALNLVNDLDLVVTGPAGTYLGNVWSGGESTTGGSADFRNVEECVRRAAPQVGRWTVRVEGTNVPFGPQSFALVVAGGLGTAGTLALDATSYGPGQSVGIRVEDPDGGGSVSVTVESSTEAAGETVFLAGGDGVYEGSIPLSLAAPAADGVLSVSHGDLVTVTYVDGSPSQTTMATATIDADDPEITSVAADPADVSAIITWDTSGFADSQIEYGTSPALGSFSTLDSDLRLAHSHAVEGLSPETTYWYDVLSRDSQGNLVRDDLGGQHYRFTTGRRADVLLVTAEPNTTENLDRYGDALETSGWTYNLWGKEQSDEPEVGDLNSGLRSYKAVWWQVGWEQYPPFSNAQRDALTQYHDGGARIAFVSHDVAWAFEDPASGYSNSIRRAWFNETLHSDWNADPLTFSTLLGYAGDPISEDYTGGISYTPHRSGAAGDEVDLIHGTGTAAYFFRNDDSSPDDVAVRWENGSPNGTVGNGVWGGTPTRTASMFFEWLNINAASPVDAVRTDVLDKTLQWLIGADHPDAAVASPNGGETLTTSPVSIAWTAAADGAAGRSIAATRLEYSDDGGQSWTLITASPGASPYSWDVSALSTGTTYRVRAVVVDDGSPVLGGADASDADFTIAIPGNENRGPVVVAGSPGISPNPIVPPAPATLSATVTDALTGGSAVTAAEWSVGASPAPAGTGTPMGGSFGGVEAAVTAALDTSSLPTGAGSLWVRGRDAAGNWGAARELPVQVNGASTGVLAGALPAAFGVEPNVPNPFGNATSIRFALPDASPVTVRVFNVEGRLVRTLVAQTMPAGRHAVDWNGRDDRGSRAASGIYFYRVEAGAQSAERKMVLLR